MSVIQRCNNCGTTSAALGECEACHAGVVQYFCTNHNPGLWLDSPACPRCGAQFGVPDRPASARPPAVHPRVRSPAATRAPASARPRPVELGTHEGRARRSAPWQAMLEAALSARHLLPRAAPASESPPVARLMGGCLLRLVLLFVLLLLAVAGAVFVFGRGLIYY